MACPETAYVTVITNTTLIDSRPPGSVAGVECAELVLSPESIMLEKDGIDPANGEF